MNTNELKELEKILKTLGNHRRLAIILFLRKNKKARVKEIADAIKISFKATSKHLGQLFYFDIIEREQKGNEMWYSLPNIKAKAKTKFNEIIDFISNSLE